MDPATTARRSLEGLSLGDAFGERWFPLFRPPPFALWCAARHSGDLVSALWAAAEGLGDVDTACAIAGGVVAARTGVEGVPVVWLERREALAGVGGRV
ncbi:ADP-ribosylglycohydrolase family protein [Streptomyces antibioticus]|uniref:ADP-ribosylglycohydrolase family protein n=1 Tax=Streptomyces antibioticus TaxID=1890 RepID=UPI003F4B049A